MKRAVVESAGPLSAPVLLLALCLLSVANGQNSQDKLVIQAPQQINCAYRAPTDPSKLDVDLEVYGELNEDKALQKCGYVPATSAPHNEEVWRVGHCATMWEEEVGPNNETTQRVLAQGCWYGRSNPDCNADECAARRRLHRKRLSNAFLCCCTGNMCNTRFVYTPTTTPPMPTQEAEIPLPPPLHRRPLAWAGLIALCLLILLALIGHRRLRIALACPPSDLEKPPLQSQPLDQAKLLDVVSEREDDPRSPASVDLNSVQLIKPIGQGRYGSVFLARKADGGEVAVKIYQPGSREFFLNEVEVYQVPHMRHPGLLELLGWGEVEKRRGQGTVQTTGLVSQFASEGNSENAEGLAGLATDESAQPSLIRETWLLTQHHPAGNLQDYLKTNTLSWDAFCRMGLSLTDALAFLHAPHTEGGATKPPIAHRDLSSRNVLVKEDGRLLLCDLGFAHPLSKEFLAAAARDGHCLALNEVGTLRYMSPEILEGAVNLLDPVAALKAVDVYALGFVLWELLSRTHDISSLSLGGVTPEYRAPLAAEMEGTPLTLDSLQVWVCRKKVRPTLPHPLRKINHQVLRSLRELVEDSWDGDAEARPSAICAHYRIQDLAAVKFESVRRAGVSEGRGGRREGEEPAEPRPPSPGALQPYQGLNPCQERNLYQLAEDQGSCESGSLESAAMSALGGPKPDPCSPLTLRQLLVPPPEAAKQSNAEREARRATADPQRDLLLALLRAEVAATGAVPEPSATPTAPTGQHPPLHTSNSAKSIPLSHANRLFEDREPPLGRLAPSSTGESPRSNHSSPALDEGGASLPDSLFPLSSSIDHLPKTPPSPPPLSGLIVPRARSQSPPLIHHPRA